MMYRLCPQAHTEGRYASGSCRRCAKDNSARWRAANPERRKAIWRKANHARDGIPAPTRSMPSACELCGRIPVKGILHLDHDHESGRFRGWLCMHCNTSIGQLGDNVAGLQRALAYLTRGLI